MRVVIVGGGVFGIVAAIELARRGRAVELLDPGPLPRPEAASTDLSKAVRMDYGADEFYTELAEESIVGWRAWNREWDRPLYHEVGFVLLTRQPMTADSYEGAAFDLLSRRGRPVERLDRAAVARRFPAWNAAAFADGYLNPDGGWVESAEVMRRLVARAADLGVELRSGVEVVGLCEVGSRVAGVRCGTGEVRHADQVVVAAGAWTPSLLPQLADRIWPTAQPVLYFRPEDPRPFLGRRFPVWGAEISRTGWYGFPANADGVVKVANHGPGARRLPSGARTVDGDAEARFRSFLATSLPALAGAPLLDSRLCFYCDTWDGDFWIDHDPARPGLFVAAGGSGHAFKFAPLLGTIVADRLEGRGTAARTDRFAWRARGPLHTEEARYFPGAGGNPV